MEPQNPQRKIIFSSPGKVFGVTATTNPQKVETPTQTPIQKPSQETTSPHTYTATPITPEHTDVQKPVVTQPAFRSFAHDIKTNVTDQGVTMAHIIMEEERKKQMTGTTQDDLVEKEQKSNVLKMVLIVIGSIAMIGGGIALFITYQNVAPIAPLPITEDYSLIRAQKISEIELRDGLKDTLIQAFKGIAATRVPAETFLEVNLVESQGTTSQRVSLRRLGEIMDARMPDALSRAVTNEYVLGMYGTGQESIPFLMFTVDTFENGYIGMKEWEQYMIGDIGALFLERDQITSLISSSTSALFQDKVYYNKDTRTVFGIDKKPLLVWAIVDRTRIVITKNGETLQALMNRITLENIRR